MEKIQFLNSGTSFLKGLRGYMLVSLLLLLLLPLFSFSCKKMSDISTQVADMEAVLPISLGPMGSVTAIADEDSVVAMTITLDNDVVDIKQLNINREGLIEAFGRQFYSSNERALLETMIEENVDFLVRYTDAKNTVTKTVRLKAEEIKAVAKRDLSADGAVSITPRTSSLSPRGALMESIVESDCKTLPTEVNPGLTLVAVDTTASGIRYTTHVDTTKVSATLLKTRQTQLHDNILSTIRNSKDAAARQTYRLCGEYKVALIFVYTLPKGKKITQVTISPEDILKATKNK